MASIIATIITIAIFISVPVGILFFDDWVKRRRTEREFREAGEIVFPRPHRIESVGVPQDLVDAHCASTIISGRLRPVLRKVFLFLGVLWASAPIWVFIVGSADADLASFLLWLSGCLVVWLHLLRPTLERIRLKKCAPEFQESVIEFCETGIEIREGCAGSTTRPWDEVEDAIPTKDGLLIQFSAYPASWIPARVFFQPGEMLALVLFIRAHRYGQGAAPEGA